MKIITPLSVHGCYDVFHSNNTTYVICPYHVTLNVDYSTEIICPHKHTRIYSVPSFKVNINGTTVTPNVYEIPKKQLALSTLEKDSSKYVYHWLNYHSQNGTGYFFIYDNNSSDEEFEKIVKTAEPFDGIIFRWNYIFIDEVSGRSAQTTQQNHTLYISRHSIDRVALLDLDEYIVTYQPLSLDDVLKPRLTMLWWLWFGAMTDSTDPRSYTRCKRRHEEQWYHKMIVDPTYVDLVSVHNVLLPDRIESTAVRPEFAVLHHYRGLNEYRGKCPETKHESCEFCECTNYQLNKHYNHTSTSSTPGK